MKQSFFLEQDNWTLFDSISIHLGKQEPTGDNLVRASTTAFIPSVYRNVGLVHDGQLQVEMSLLSTIS